MTESRVIVRGSARDAAQVPMRAKQLVLEFQLSRPGSGTALSPADGVMVTTDPVLATPDDNGDFVVWLTPNDLIQGDTFYQVTARWADEIGEIMRRDLYRIFVPVTGGWISELAGSHWNVAQVIYNPVRPEPWPVGIVWINSITGDVHQNRGTKLTWIGNISGQPGADGKPGAPGAPGVNAVPAQAAVAAYLKDPNSDVYKAVMERIEADRKAFDLAKAQVEYGARAMRPISENRVMQSVHVSAKTGDIWYSQVASGTQGGRESTVVARCSPTGTVLGEMLFVDAGHGTGMFVEQDSAGKFWVWLSFINQAIASGNGRFNYVRVPWQPGITMTWAQAASYKVAALSRASYLTAHYDEGTGDVGVRDNPDPNASTYQFSRHKLTALKAGTWAPADQFSYTPGSDWLGQGWALLDQTWYLLSGSGSTYSPYFPAAIWRLNTSGVRTLVRSVEESRYSPLGAAPGGFTEPEGLAAARGPKGEPSLVFGVSTGPTGGRAYTFWSAHMGAEPFVNQRQGQDAAWGDTGWTNTLVKTWDNGFSGDTTTSQKFEGRIVGGYLELDGRVNGSFTSGQNIIGTLREGYYSPVKQRRGLATKSMGAGSPSASVRVEIGTTGKFSIFLPAGDSTVSWIDFTGFRAPLFIERGVSSASS